MTSSCNLLIEIILNYTILYLFLFTFQLDYKLLRVKIHVCLHHLQHWARTEMS